MSCGDAYPSKWAAKLEKDDYTCKVHVRHERREMMEKIQDMSLLVSSKLPSAVSAGIYSSFTQASGINHLAEMRKIQIFQLIFTKLRTFYK